MESIEEVKGKIKFALTRFSLHKNLARYEEDNAEAQADYLAKQGYSVQDVAAALKSLLSEPLNGGLDIALIIQRLTPRLNAIENDIIKYFNEWYYKINACNAITDHDMIKELNNVLLYASPSVIKSKIKDYYYDCTSTCGNNYWFAKGDADFNLKQFLRHFDEINTYEGDRKALRAADKLLLDEINKKTGILGEKGIKSLANPGETQE